MIDIIIPVYDGYEETKECIESVIAFQNPLEHRIFLIDDCSPNKKINELLLSCESGR
ncbi:MAG: glycosyltransferase [Streptococcaceae bacterium]|jgi:GT2 family glycosyltransferase|nr:glycosyltransferase [Streptococcaceae bacterium]